MSTAALPMGQSSRGHTANAFRIFLSESRYEFLRMLRTRTFSLSVIGFPIMFYTLFGLLMNRNAQIGGITISKYLLGGYAVFGLIGASLFGIGVGLAGELAAGWLELKRASPMPAVAYLLAKCGTAIVFGVIIVSLLCTLGVTAGHVPLTAWEYGRMIFLTIAGAVPFASMGLLLALIVPANSAPGIVNMIYLPMSFLSGLWMPIEVLPHALQTIAPLLPTYHLAQLMLGIFGARRGSTANHWAGLAGFTCLMLGFAWIAFRRSEQNA